MGVRIQQLPPAIANQIAAGEVIERPASVVKELLENSLDADADNLTIEINYGGLNNIKISDNGIGIVAADLPLAIAAHATSKITTLNDLYAISSMGFRGEALASIASIAKVTISSRTVEQENAMMLKVQGAEISLTPCARNVGTTIEVADLFFNAPVRKRFLKSEKLEFQAIETVVKRFALSAPGIAITLKHNDKLILSLPAALNDQAKRTRMTKIFGSSFIKDAVSIDVEGSGMWLYGWLSGPDFQRGQNDKQWVYINQRMVKDKLINHAIKQAYDGYLHPGRFPACLLYFEINSAEVDVNVHPTKHEVRFQQPRLVHDFFTSQLTKALAAVVDVRDDREYEPSYLQQEIFTAISEPAMQMDPPSPYPLPHAARGGEGEKQEDNLNSWIILNNHYALIFLQSQHYLVDILRLQQLWLHNFLSTTIFPLANRPLLVPITYPLSVNLQNKVTELEHGLSQLGLHIECIKDNIRIKSVPINIPYLDLRLLIDLIANIECIKSDTLLKVILKAQVFAPHLLSKEERLELNQFLLNKLNVENTEQNLYKALTNDACRMLLNV